MKIEVVKSRSIVFFILLGWLLCGCSEKKVALDRQQFESLLIDMHWADATLNRTRKYGDEEAEKRNYAYYNTLFAKYGIDRAQFDSCLYYYSSQTALFDKMYDAVIDSLSRRGTYYERIMNRLRAQDSVNYFPVADTILFDTAHWVQISEIDSIVSGYYKFNTTLRFDTVDNGKNNRITAWFISEDNKDTLRVKDVKVLTDTVLHYYSWSQYVDSSYRRLVIKFVESDNLKKLKYRKGRAWNTTLFKPYLSPKSEESMKRGEHTNQEPKADKAFQFQPMKIEKEVKMKTELRQDRLIKTDVKKMKKVEVR